MRIKKVKISKLVLIAIAVVVMTGILYGCVRAADTTGEITRGLYGFSGNMTTWQSRWILAGEITLVSFLVSLIVLLVALFQRYRRSEKHAMEVSLRARTLMKENEILDRLNRTKTEFFQNMSHDFKTPLTVVSTSVLNAIDLLDFEMDIEEMRESLTLAQSEIMRMARIVDGALKHAAMHDNRQSEEVIDLEQLLNKVVRTYQAFLEGRGNTLLLSLPTSLPPVYTNADMLLNILSNLISNANKFTRDGKITIFAELADKIPGAEDKRRFVSITVSDTGTGVNPEILSNIFKRGATEGGTGLGLSICKTAIESYGGNITLNSQPNRGTNVTFTVPVYDKEINIAEEDVTAYEY